MGAQKGTPARSVLALVLVLSFVALGAAVLVLRLGPDDYRTPAIVVAVVAGITALASRVGIGFDRSTGVRHPRRRTRIRSRGRRSGGNYY